MRSSSASSAALVVSLVLLAFCLAWAVVQG